MLCEGVEHDTHFSQKDHPLKACLLESKSEAPSDKNYLTVLHFKCLGLSVSSRPVKQILSVRGVKTEIHFAAGI